MEWHYAAVDLSAENGGEPWVELMEVSADGYGATCLGAENKDALVAVLKRILADLEHYPVQKFF